MRSNRLERIYALINRAYNMPEFSDFRIINPQSFPTQTCDHGNELECPFCEFLEQSKAYKEEMSCR